LADLGEVPKNVTIFSSKCKIQSSKLQFKVQSLLNFYFLKLSTDNCNFALLTLNF